MRPSTNIENQYKIFKRSFRINNITKKGIIQAESVRVVILLVYILKSKRFWKESQIAIIGEGNIKKNRTTLLSLK
jgi:hypothetical protein